MLELLDQYHVLKLRSNSVEADERKQNKADGQKVLHIDSAQANTVRRVFELRQQFPTWTLKQIASQLNQEGFKTRQGSQFRKVQVKRILDHESTYRGMIQYGQIEAVGVHQAII